MTQSTKKPAKPTKSQLLRKIQELQAQMAFTYVAASSEIEKTGQERLMASGVLLQLSALGGRELITPVVIRDGLSAATIAAIKADIIRSYELATVHKPKL